MEHHGTWNLLLKKLTSIFVDLNCLKSNLAKLTYTLVFLNKKISFLSNYPTKSGILLVITVAAALVCSFEERVKERESAMYMLLHPNIMAVTLIIVQI